MNAKTETSFDAVMDGIVATIEAKFPDWNVSDHRNERTDLKLPACLVELEEFEAAEEDPGTGQIAMNTRFSARLIISFRQKDTNPKREIRRAVWEFLAFARLQRWGLPIGPAEVRVAAPDDFDPDLDNYEIWRIEWEQVINIGKSIWDDDGEPPSDVFIGQAPLIGADYVDEYQHIAGEPGQ